MHYQEELDKIFADRELWKHRTLRTVLDPFCTEYKYTSLSQKIEILKKCIDNDLDLQELVDSYKDFYYNENKNEVPKSVELGLINLISEIFKNKNI